jgi:peptidyl-dipeptidase A
VAAQYKAQREAELRTAKQMTERAQDFYVSLGMPSLPQSYWERPSSSSPMTATWSATPAPGT